ncbi:hypothetical protein ACB092_07G032700 [Castanea dentata]
MQLELNLNMRGRVWEPKDGMILLMIIQESHLVTN